MKKPEMNYYYVMYGTSLRLSDKCISPEAAMKYCFGMVDHNRMTVRKIGARSPRYLSLKVINPIKEAIEADHKERQRCS